MKIRVRVGLTICSALILVTFALSGAAPAYACGGSMDHSGMDHGQMGYGQTSQGYMGSGPGVPGGPAYASPAPQGTWSPAPGVPQGRQQTAPAPPAPGSTHDHQH